MARPRPTVSSGGIGEKSPLRVMDRRLSIYRGTTASSYGDLSDVGALYMTGVPAAIAETSQQAFDPATQRPSIIRAIQCVVPGWAGVQTTDTLLDPATGNYYMVESSEAEPGFGFYPPRTLLTLRERSGVSVQGEQS